MLDRQSELKVTRRFPIFHPFHFIVCRVMELRRFSPYTKTIHFPNRVVVPTTLALTDDVPLRHDSKGFT